MPKIKLHLDIQIHNYSEIAKKNSGMLASILANVPIVGSFVESKVDAEIAKRVKASLGQEVANSLQDELSRNGVSSKISFSFSD